MLLTRTACYGVLAAQHLAEHEGCLSAHQLAELYGLPREALAKILQRLAMAGLLLSHHGIKGGYTLARNPRLISVFDVIRQVKSGSKEVTANAYASCRSKRRSSSLQGEPTRRRYAARAHDRGH